MATGLVYNSATPASGVTFTLAEWAPVVASPLANLVAVANNGFFLPAANGILATIAAFASTSLNSLASGGAVTSAAFSQTDTTSAKEGYVWFVSGNPGITPAGAGANLAGWFITSMDGGTTYEDPDNTPSTTVPALSRAPDFVIPLDLVATGTAGKRKFASGRVKLPSTFFKVVLQNNSGVALGSGATTVQTLSIAPVA